MFSAVREYYRDLERRDDIIREYKEEIRESIIKEYKEEIRESVINEYREEIRIKVIKDIVLNMLKIGESDDNIHLMTKIPREEIAEIRVEHFNK